MRGGCSSSGDILRSVVGRHGSPWRGLHPPAWWLVPLKRMAHRAELRFWTCGCSRLDLLRWLSRVRRIFREARAGGGYAVHRAALSQTCMLVATAASCAAGNVAECCCRVERGAKLQRCHTLAERASTLLSLQCQHLRRRRRCRSPQRPRLARCQYRLIPRPMARPCRSGPVRQMPGTAAQPRCRATHPQRQPADLWRYPARPWRRRWAPDLRLPRAQLVRHTPRSAATV